MTDFNRKINHAIKNKNALHVASEVSCRSDLSRFIHLFLSLGIEIEVIRNPADSSVCRYKVVAETPGFGIGGSLQNGFVAKFDYCGKFEILDFKKIGG